MDRLIPGLTPWAIVYRPFGAQGPAAPARSTILACTRDPPRRIRQPNRRASSPDTDSNSAGVVRGTRTTRRNRPRSGAAGANIAAGHAVILSSPQYQSLTNPVARRLYRLLEVARSEGAGSWRIPLERLAEQLPLTQRYPSHLQRVLQPAHEMLIASGLLREAVVRQVSRAWTVDYALSARTD